MRPLLVGALAVLTASKVAASPREIYQKSGAAVVLILGSDDGRTGSGGTGSIVSADGKIITNGHVVLNKDGVPYKTIYVYLKPAKVTGDNATDLQNRYVVKVKGFSPASALDLALLQIEEPPANLPVVQFGDPNEVSVGDPVVAIGHPEQGGLWTLTTGTVSTVIQNFDRIKGKHVFQTEASFNRGNSGGPLFDEHGNMIGINTMIARKATDGLAITAVNFSLKSSVAVDWLKSAQQVNLAYATPQAGATAGPALAQNAPPSKVAEPPAAAGAAAEPPPPLAMNEQKSAATVSDSGKALPPSAEAPPKGAKIQTEKRPFNLDQLLKDQMKELEDMMGEMHQKVKNKSKAGKRGMGL